jgi:hypothetical protein
MPRYRKLHDIAIIVCDNLASDTAGGECFGNSELTTILLIGIKRSNHCEG